MNDKVPPSLNRFAAELEDAIRRELGARRDGRLVHMLRARPRLLAGTTVGAAVTAASLALALSAAGTSPAFAVTRHHDGSYSVTLRSLKGIRAANLKLSQMGVPVQLIQVPATCALGPQALANALVHVPRSVRIYPRKLRPGRKLVIGAWRNGNQVSIAPALSIHGAARGCALLPCPPATLPTGNQKQVPVTVTSLSAGKSGKLGKNGSPRALRQTLAPARIKCPTPAPLRGANSATSGSLGSGS